jgi:hypothetical protein
MSVGHLCPMDTILTFEVIHQFQLCFLINIPDNVRIVSKNKIEEPHRETFKSSLIFEKCELY